MQRRFFLSLSLLALLAMSSIALAAPPPYNGPSPAPGMDILQKQMIQGRVEAVQGQKAIVRTHSGRRVEVNLGPQAYWHDKGYRLHAGTPIRVQGYGRGSDDGPFFAAGIWGPDFYFELTNDRGFPYWADQDDYWDGWYPSYEYYNAYYFGRAPYAYGPPPPWWYGTPPPRWWYARHHYYGHPGFRWGWHQNFDRPHHGRGHDRGPGQWRGRDRDDNDRGRGDRDRDDRRGGERRGGRRGR